MELEYYKPRIKICTITYEISAAREPISIMEKYEITMNFEIFK